MVVIGHVSLGNNLVKWIYSFHMPLFFALSGYMLVHTQRNYSNYEFILKRTRSLLLPFVIFRILLIGYWFIIESHFRSLDLGPIWFLIVLYIVEIVSYPILRKKLLCLNIIITIIVSCLLYYYSLCDLDVIGLTAWGIRIATAFVWYMMGNLCGQYEQKWNIKIKEKCKSNNREKIFILFCLFCISIWSSMNNSLVSMWSNCFGDFSLWIVGNVSGSLFVALLCKWIIVKLKLIERYGRNTIIILATHEPIKRVILKSLEILLNKCNVRIAISNLQNNLIISFIVVILIMAIEILIIEVFCRIKYLCPEFIQKKWLGWICD